MSVFKETVLSRLFVKRSCVILLRVPFLRYPVPGLKSERYGCEFIPHNPPPPPPPPTEFAPLPVPSLLVFNAFYFKKAKSKCCQNKTCAFRERIGTQACCTIYAGDLHFI